LEFCVRNAYSPQEFVERCRDEGLSVSEETLHTNLYEELVKLDKANKNGVWARIIKNAFAPLFVGKVDYVAGNPPWVNWRNLPVDYRDGMAPLWEQYGLFTQKGLQARLGAGMDDISVLMTYVSGNTYLADDGRLGFVITQTLFQSAGGGQGFRRFSLPNGNFFRVDAVHDFSSFQPFEGATNRTATIAMSLSRSPTTYPVNYFKMSLGADSGPISDEPIAFPQLQSDAFEAKPISSEVGAPWLVLKRGMWEASAKILGKSEYTARIGAHSGGAAGVYWVDILKREKQSCLIANRWDAGRNPYPSVTASVECAMVRPLARGRDVDRWEVNPSLSIVIPYDPKNYGKAISEARLKKEYPKTFAYFQQFRDAMVQRPHYLHHFKPSGQPYWSMYNVGDYSFADYRLVWREQSSSFKCAVIEGENAPIADAKLIVVACHSSDEAHYLAAMLNSAPARYVIEAYVVKVQISTHVLKNIRVPTYSETETTHRKLAQLSRACHRSAVEKDWDKLRTVEEQIDQTASQLWELGSAELRRIKISLQDN
jgi:hypothetical protein